MRTFYCVLPSGRKILSVFTYRYIILLVLVFLAAAPVFSQQYTLFEDFENVETGKLPSGWTWYQEGGTDPASHWTTSKVFGFGTRHATSGLELGNGKMDSDWLITPKVDVTAGDYLIFDASQSTWMPYGDEYFVAISTSTPSAPVAFKDTIARYTESTLPKSWGTIKLDLSAYAGKSVYIAFIHVSTYLSQDEYDIANAFLVDEVWVRPLQAASLLQAQATFQIVTATTVADAWKMANLSMNIQVSGDNGTVSLDAMTFTTTGTTDPSIIESVMVCYTGSANLLNVEDTESYTVFGTSASPDGRFVLTGHEDLPLGNNYFWLVYSIKPDARPEFPYPRIDATFEEVVVNGVTRATAVSTKPGAVAIVPNRPLNDSLKHAIEIPGTGRYGSSNVNAKPEREYETLAYCAPGGQDDGGNSIWWHFTAPDDGWITADLSACEFNSLLVFFDKNFDQLACHDNINAAENRLQSHIGNFAVAAGQEVYLRVTGVGEALGGPDNADRGEVILDFTFDRPMSVEQPGDDAYRLSVPYPNPAAAYTAVELSTLRSGDVTLDLYDRMGRKVLSVPTGYHRAGEKRKIIVDVARLPVGTYMIRVEGSSIPAGKLMVLR